MPGIIAVGTSMGGLDALRILLSGLPPQFPVPMIIVQHRGKEPGDTLVRLLQEKCALSVSEPDDKEVIAAGHVYLAPADYHILVDGGRIALSTEPVVQHARPSIDVLFESSADTYRRAAVALVLTGANADGASGAARIKALGGRVVVQDPTTAASPLMPRAAIAATCVDCVLMLAEIAPFLVSMCSPQGSAAA
jgi:two-component system, chemotaxis family, protein-glutamate methylesterase/glutaminase